MQMYAKRKNERAAKVLKESGEINLTRQTCLMISFKRNFLCCLWARRAQKIACYSRPFHITLSDSYPAREVFQNIRIQL